MAPELNLSVVADGPWRNVVRVFDGGQAFL